MLLLIAMFDSTYGRTCHLDLACSFLVLYSYLCQQQWPGLCRNGHGIAAPYKIYWVLPKAGFLPQPSSCPSIQVDAFFRPLLIARGHRGSQRPSGPHRELGILSDIVLRPALLSRQSTVSGRRHHRSRRTGLRQEQFLVATTENGAQVLGRTG